jgi:EAL domain-containing protein (putative c-di-GMP-specific phosphodiesterase class I)
MRLANDLRSALLSEQLVIHYQPIVDLVDGSIYKAEALIRWKHPKLGLVSPAEFIPLAESSGLIIEIGDWVFKQSALQVLRWRALFHAEFQISVNKSPMQFTDDGRLQADWFAHLQHLNLPGQSMVVEITEGLLLASRIDVMAQLEALRNAGIGVSLDDFGTGYSSLSYLQKYPIDYVKIDQSFVRNLVPGSKDLALCKAIIVMAHELGMKVIAEGVETTEQCRLLMTAGCDFGQGYFFSRPVPATDFEALRHTFVLPMAASVPIST